MARLLRDTGMIHAIVQLQSLVGNFADGSLQVDEVDALLQQIAAEQGETLDANGLPEALVDCLWRATTVGAATATQADDAAEEAARRLERLGTLVQHLHGPPVNFRATFIGCRGKKGGPDVVLSNAYAKTIKSTSFLDKDMLCERLDPALLQYAGLISDASAFLKREVRFRTGLLYKQQKFNLLREENEGYSKLIAEFDAFIGNTPNEAAIKRAKQLMNNIQSLIGYFDLDPNRVLDVLADLAASRLASHWRFLLTFFKNSPWFLHDQQAVSPCPCSANLRGRTGNTNAAQIMGFKFAGLTGDDDAQGLLLLMALWIKEGMIRLIDLWPHLLPTEEAFADGKREYRDHLDNEKDKARGGSMLAMAGALADDDDATPATQKTGLDPMQLDTPAEPVKPVTHKQQLVHALIAVGAIPEIMFLLAEYPFLLGLNPEMADSFCILVEYAMQPLSHRLRPQQKYAPDTAASLRQGKAYSSDTKYRDSKLIIPHPPQIRYVLDPSPTFSTPQIVERFFYDEVSSQIKACDSFADFEELILPYLRIAGVQIHRHAKLISKVALIGYAAIREDESRRSFWMTIIRSSLLPALSLLQTNPAIVNDVHQLVASYDREQRYSFYGEWHTSLYKTIPELRVQLVKTEKETKGTLRRISKTNVKEFGRLLAKSSHSNPCVVLSIALNQIESYDNLVEVVIEASRYFTFLTFDVLAYILLTLLSNNIKRRLKEDGTSVAHWLQSLSSFTAKIYKRYSHLDPAPICLYVAKQLKVDNAFDLIILQDLITEMGGIRPSSDLSEDQLQGCTGGPLLRAEALSLINERQDVTAKTASRLLEALQRSGLTIPFALMIGNQRACCVYRTHEATSLVKLLANLQDTCHSILIQYLDFLSIYKDSGLDQPAMPKVVDMIYHAHLQPAVAFMLARPALQVLLRQYNMKMSAQRKLQPVKSSPDKMVVDDSVEPDLPEDAGSAKTTTATEKKETDDGKVDENQEDSKMEEVSATAGNNHDAKDNANEVKDMTSVELHPIISELAENVTSILPESIWNSLPPRLYASFWTLDSYDMTVPIERYAKEIKQLRSSIKENQPDREDTYSSARAKEAEIARANDLLPQLQAEMKAQMQNSDYLLHQLAQEKSSWYTKAANEDEYALRSHYVLQYCLLPRSLLSPNDASYCARFVTFLHSAKVPHFSMVHLYEELFGPHLATSIFTATEREVENLGRFLGLVLKSLNKLQASEATYNLTPILLTPPTSDDMRTQSFENFKGMWYTFHRSLWNCVKVCLASKEFMQIRNILIVLEKMSSSYPHFKWVGSNISRELDRLIASERREDLKIRALGCKAILKKQQSSWVEAPGKQVAEDESKKVSQASSPSQANSTAALIEPRDEARKAPDGAPQSPAAANRVADSAPAARPVSPGGEAPAAQRNVVQSSSSPNARPGSPPRDLPRVSRTEQLRGQDDQSRGHSRIQSRAGSRGSSPRREDRPRPRSSDAGGSRRDRDSAQDDRRARDGRRADGAHGPDLEPGRLNGPPVQSTRPEKTRSEDRLNRDWRRQPNEPQADERQDWARRKARTGREDRDCAPAIDNRDSRDRISAQDARDNGRDQRNRHAAQDDRAHGRVGDGRDTRNRLPGPDERQSDRSSSSRQEERVRSSGQDGRAQSHNNGNRQDLRDRPASREAQNARRGPHNDQLPRVAATGSRNASASERQNRPDVTPADPPHGPRRSTEARSTDTSSSGREHGRVASTSGPSRHALAGTRQPPQTDAEADLKPQRRNGHDRSDSRQGAVSQLNTADAPSRVDPPGPYVHPSRLVGAKDLAPTLSSSGRRAPDQPPAAVPQQRNPLRLERIQPGSRSPRGGDRDRNSGRGGGNRADRSAGQGRRDGRQVEQASTARESERRGDDTAHEQTWDLLPGKRLAEENPAGNAGDRAGQSPRGGKRQRSGYEGDGRGPRDRRSRR